MRKIIVYLLFSWSLLGSLGVDGASSNAFDETDDMLSRYFNIVVVKQEEDSIDGSVMHDQLFLYFTTNSVASIEFKALCEILVRVPDSRYNSMLTTRLGQDPSLDIAICNALSVTATASDLVFLCKSLIQRLNYFESDESPKTGPIWKVMIWSKLSGKLNSKDLIREVGGYKEVPNASDWLLKIEKAFEHLDQLESKYGTSSGGADSGTCSGLLNSKANQKIEFKFWVYLQNNSLYPESILHFKSMEKEN